MPSGIQLELSEPPAGITMQDVNVIPGEITFLIAADSKTAKVGLVDNLIVNVSADRPKILKAVKRKHRSSRLSWCAACHPI